MRAHRARDLPRRGLKRAVICDADIVSRVATNVVVQVVGVRVARRGDEVPKVQQRQPVVDGGSMCLRSASW